MDNVRPVLSFRSIVSALHSHPSPPAPFPCFRQNRFNGSRATSIKNTYSWIVMMDNTAGGARAPGWTENIPNDARLISERVHDVPKSVQVRKTVTPKQPNLPNATSQALRSCEWWAFFTSLSARIFSKARVRNMFFVFLPSYMSHRNLSGEFSLVPVWGLQLPRMEMYPFWRMLAARAPNWQT